MFREWPGSRNDSSARSASETTGSWASGWSSRDDQEDLLGEEMGHRRARRSPSGYDPEVQLPVEDPLFDQGVVPLDEIEVDLGVGLEERGQDGRQEVAEDGPRRAHSGPARYHSCMLADQPGGLVGTGDDGLAMGSSSFAVGGALDAPAVPLEQPDAEFSLQTGDLPADGGLGEVGQRGGPGEAADFGRRRRTI